MSVALALAIIFTFFTSSSHGALVLERCIRNSQCTTANSFCRIISPSCASGTCSCFPSFEVDQRRIWCKRIVQVDQPCRYRFDSCFDPNSECVEKESLCLCKTGYKTAPYGGECIPEVNNLMYGDECNSTEECYTNLECRPDEQVCDCPTGFQPKDNFQCVPKPLGSQCLSDDECSQNVNSACINGICTCAEGSRREKITKLSAKEYQYEPTFAKSYQCYKYGESPALEIKRCNVYSVLGPIINCKYPLECRFCALRLMCVRPLVRYNTFLSSSLQVEPCILLILVVLIAAINFENE